MNSCILRFLNEIEIVTAFFFPQKGATKRNWVLKKSNDLSKDARQANC